MSVALRMPQPWLTAERFMDWPGDGTGRQYQLVDGELVAIAPPSPTHGRLQARLATRLNNHLAAHRPGCEAVTNAGVQPRVDAAHNVRVPDLSVSCSADLGKFVEGPVLIAEILSPSNMRETREAVRACLTIPSLAEVLILASEAVAAEVLRRGADGFWPAEPLRLGPGDDLALDGLGFRCAMDELYAGLGVS